MSIFLSKLVMRLSRLLGYKGTNIGGIIALKLNKNIFTKLINNIDNIILITGTNGKSTITNIIAQTLEIDNNVISNKEGANMYTGIISSMIKQYKFFSNKRVKYAVFEVDEGSIERVLNEIDKAYLVISNFFRDQLDRYSEIDMIVSKLKDSLINKDNIKLVLNVDDPYCLRLVNNNYIGYGLDKNIDIFKDSSISDSKYCAICGNELVYSKVFFNQLGYYECSCGFKRLEPKYLLKEVLKKELRINNKVYLYSILGSYNIYNILASIALLKELNINDEYINNTLTNFNNIPGRMQLYKFNNNDIYINLVKNHAGMNLSLQELKLIKPNHMCFILNDYTADGKDVSWIWDADFEYLLAFNIKHYFIAGTRCYDLALRLKNMGIDTSIMSIDPLFDNIVDDIIKDNAYIISSYSAIWKAIKTLDKKGLK